MLCFILTNKADDCCDGQISSIYTWGHTSHGLDPHCDVLVGWDTVGLSQLQHRGYSRVVCAHTHHPTTVIKGLRRQY